MASIDKANANSAIEDVLEHLVNWADAALETSSNQPVLPHVIIALNASENNIDEQLWDPEFATSDVLESLSRTVFKNTTFKKYAQFWRERKRQIETVLQLIRSYYSSIKVRSLPQYMTPSHTYRLFVCPHRDDHSSSSYKSKNYTPQYHQPVRAQGSVKPRCECCSMLKSCNRTCRARLITLPAHSTIHSTSLKLHSPTAPFR